MADAATSVPVPTAPACAIPADALAWSGVDGRCGFVLEGAQETTLTLRALVGDQAWPVSVPEACSQASCDYRIAETALGPLIVATRASPAGETPSWAGLAISLGDAYRFVDLWHGESVLDDQTPAGPVHTLAPFDCAGSLALLVEPRLGGGTDEVPEPALTAAAGTPRLEGDEVVVDPVAPDGCRRLPVELP